MAAISYHAVPSSGTLQATKRLGHCRLRAAYGQADRQYNTAPQRLDMQLLLLQR